MCVYKHWTFRCLIDMTQKLLKFKNVTNVSNIALGERCGKKQMNSQPRFKKIISNKLQR